MDRFWECPECGTHGIHADVPACPGCRAPRAVPAAPPEDSPAPQTGVTPARKRGKTAQSPEGDGDAPDL